MLTFGDCVIYYSFPWHSEPIPHDPPRLTTSVYPDRRGVQGFYIKYPFSEHRLLETTGLAAAQVYRECSIRGACFIDE